MTIIDYELDHVWDVIRKTDSSRSDWKNAAQLHLERTVELTNKVCYVCRLL